MTTNLHNPASAFPSITRWCALALCGVSLCLIGCAALPTARMALTTGLEVAQSLPFEGLGASRSGSFVFDTQAVKFRRTGDALSVFDRLRLDRVLVEFERADTKGRCDGRAATVTVNIVDTPAQPLTLNCRFTGTLSGEMRLKEPRLAGAGTRQAREGKATFDALVIDIRSEHELAGSRLPLAQPAGYRLLVQGRDVAALDLTSGVPVLHRAVDLDEVTRAALNQVALALGLLFDPAVTLG